MLDRRRAQKGWIALIRRVFSLTAALLSSCTCQRGGPASPPDAGRSTAAKVRSVAPPPNPVPAGTVLEELATSQIVLFPPSLKPLRPGLVDVVAGVAAREWPALRLEKPETASQAVPAVVVAPFDSPGVSKAEIARAGHALSALDEVDLQRKSRAAILEFRFAGPQALRDLPRAQQLALSVAGELGATVILDGDSREYFSLGAWKKERVDSWTSGLPAIPRQISILQSPEGNGGLLRSVTYGMIKFGLPDVVVAHVAEGTDARGLGSLTNLVCATLVERPALDKEGLLDVDVEAIHEPTLRDALRGFVVKGGRGKATVALSLSAAPPGGPENRLIEIAFPTPDGGSAQQAQEALLSELFGG